MPRPALNYLMEQLNGRGDFTAQWKTLSDTDKDTLKRWAMEEQAATEQVA